MISYKQWKLLNESLGSFSLGLKQKQSLGVVGDHLTGSELDEMGMPMNPGSMPPMPMKKKKPFPGEEEDMEDMGDEEEMGDEELDMDGEEDEEEDVDDEEIDPDAELEDDEEEDEEEVGFMKKKKFPMGEPHADGPFMRWSRKMKSEACEDMDVEKEDEDDDDEDEEDGKEIAFLQKKQKKMKKKCGDGMMGKKCAKCAKQKKMKEATGYERPVTKDSSDKAFLNSLKDMYGNPGEKFWNGLSEDMLLPQPEPQPGEVGYAPQTRVGSDVNTMAESIQHLMKRIAELEEQLKRQ